jgi:hypothetical protein
MPSFYALIIGTDQSLVKSWINNEKALKLLQDNPNVKIFRISTDQIASIVNGAVMWKDVTIKDI